MTFILAEDLALKTYLSGMTVSDEKNPTRPVKVWFGYPDVEIRAQEFPFVTIDLIDVQEANDRQMAGYVVDADYMGTVTPNPNYWYEYEIPIAYDLIYQVSSYSRHPRHDRSLIYQLNRKFPGMRGHLPVPNDLGTSTAYRHMFSDRMLKIDRAEGENGNKRILRNIYTVRVVSEMTPETAANALTRVTQININKLPLSEGFPTDKIPV